MSLLCALVLAFYRPIALTNLILPGVDAFTYFYPYRAYAAEAVRSGQIPLWNPYLFLGAPFLANPQAAVFYPLNLALCWLPAPRLVAWSIVIHVALAALLAYLYARHGLKLSPLPAFLGASTFAFGGFVSGQVEHVNQLNVSAWFPLLLLLWDLSRPGRAGRWLALLGAGSVLGLGILAGHTQSSYISLFGLSVYALLQIWRVATTGCPSERVPRLEGRRAGGETLRHLGRILLELAIVVLVGAGLAAVQIVPTIELSRLSLRGGGLSYREVVAFSLKPLPRLLRYTFLPPWGGNLADVFGGDFFTEYVAYVGVVPLLLAVVPLCRWVMGRVEGWKGGRACPERGRLSGEGMDDAVPGLVGVGGGRSFLGVMKSLCEIDFETPLFHMGALAALGVLLALGLYNPSYFLLYKLVPGFALFRVPARWLFLYAFGAAMLAGVGLEQAGRWLDRQVARGVPLPPLPWKKMPGWWICPAVQVVVVAIALAELWLAAQALPSQHPTAPEAYTSLRTAPAHLLAAQGQEAAPGRFLSMSDILFDPGDLAEIEQMFANTSARQLSPRAIYDYIVCAKRKEILAPNLPLAWRIYAVDGYDGGVLPLARYTHLQRLFLPAEDISADGRLREQLDHIPPSRLLSIMGVRYVITDKVHDAWIDDVFYDLAFEAVLGDGAAPYVDSADIPPFTATALGIVSYLEAAAPPTDGTPVAELRLTANSGDVRTLVLRAGEGEKRGKGEEEGPGHVTRLRWGPDQEGRVQSPAPTEIVRVEIAALPWRARDSPGGRLHIQGLALIDERDGSNVPLILSTTGRFRQVHSGDVKIYEVLDTLPQAYVVHRTRVIGDDEAAIAAMADPAFDPAQVAILASGRALDGHAGQMVEAQVTVTHYAAEEVALQVSLHAPGYLVLSDAWYPGWKATVDGERAAIERANVHFRAVYLDEGTHTVRFTYRPASYPIGLGISLFIVATSVAPFARYAYRALRTGLAAKVMYNKRRSRVGAPPHGPAVRSPS
jgi:hypothetical protein